MRILIHTSSTGSSYVFTVDLAKSLQNLGVQIFLAVTGVPLNDRQIKELEQFDYAFSGYKQNWIENPWSDMLEARQWLMKIKKQFKPDIVHLNSLTFGTFPWNIPVVSVIHSCMFDRSKAIYNNKPPRHWEKYKSLAQASLRASDAVIAPSKSALNSADVIYGPFKSSRVIPPGRCTYTFRSGVKKRYIFTNGKINDDGHDLKLVLEAAPKIDYPIYIADNQGHMNVKKLPENVFLIGPLYGEKLCNWMGSASLFVLPAKYEPFGYSFVDAALSKCALIGRDIPSLREIWSDSMNYIKSKDDLISKVNYLMQNNEEIYLYGQKAYEAALENYTLIKMTRHFYQLYQRILSHEHADLEQSF